MVSPFLFNSLRRLILFTLVLSIMEAHRIVYRVVLLKMDKIGVSYRTLFGNNNNKNVKYLKGDYLRLPAKRGISLLEGNPPFVEFFLTDYALLHTKNIGCGQDRYV